VALLDPMQRQLRDVSRQVTTTRRLHQRHSWTLRQLGKQLQQAIGQARMIPAESLIEGHRKMVRDLAREAGKEIEFHASSAGIHADRRVLEALKDPILHILRNAISHGLESPEERAQKNKPVAGRLTLRVDTNGQRLNIVVEDDGRGIDFARVSELAVREGIVSEATAAHGSTEDLIRILFRPGFSTAKTVTNLSGRGMGLSVVYESIRRLQGDLEIHPAKGGGTQLSLSVPLTVASHKLLLVQSGEQVFAIPLLGIESLRRIRVAQIETMEGKPVIRLDHHPVPLHLATLQSLLGLEHASRRTDPDHLQIVILRSGGRRIAVAVDAVLKETDAQLHDLGPAAGCDGKIASAVILDDGGVAFLLNPFELVESELLGNFTVAAWSLRQAPELPAVSRTASILVVDDSLTTRALEKNILEANGYRVRIAGDGLEALELLREEKADLVISDIEMPSLNGFGLVEAMKADRELARIPVIIVSSVERREDQERGLALGADAYVIKGRFDQSELLATIRQII
jgi:two-component system chemotaxis sensor kinase CheA